MIKEKSVIKIIGLHLALYKAELLVSFHCLIQKHIILGEGVLGGGWVLTHSIMVEYF